MWLVAGLVLAGMLRGTLQVLAEDDPAAETSGVPIESLILPAVATIACLGAIRLVPFGLWLAPALLATGLLVERCLAIESAILASRSGAGFELPRGLGAAAECGPISPNNAINAHETP